MSDSSQDAKPTEPHWLMKALVTAFLITFVNAFAGALLTVGGFLLAGILHFAQTDTAVIIILGLSSLALAGFTFILGIRLTIGLLLDAVKIVWKALPSIFKSITQPRPTQSPTPQTLDQRLKELSLDEDKTTSPWREKYDAWVALALFVILVPKRHRPKLPPKAPTKTSPQT